MNTQVTQVDPAPDWILDLVSKAQECLAPINVMGQLGYRWLPPDHEINSANVWVLGVYPCSNELRGGRTDGKIINPGFEFRLSSLLSEFSTVENLAWIHPTVYNGGLEGPRFCIDGSYGKHNIRFQFFAVAPTDEDPSLIIDMASGDWWQKRS